MSQHHGGLSTGCPKMDGCQPAKTQQRQVLFAPKQIAVSTRNISVAVGNTHVSAITSVRNLGVMLDTTLSMDDQVKAVCRTAYAQLRGIVHIRRYRTTDAAKKVVNSLVTTRMDYCNSLLYGIPGRLLARKHCSQDSIPDIQIRPHHPCIVGAPLATYRVQAEIQGITYGTPGSTWQRPTVPGRYTDHIPTWTIT